MRKVTVFPVVRCVVTGSVLLALSGFIAKADLRVQSEVKITHPSDTTAQNQTDKQSPVEDVQSFTTYYKGDKVRVEREDGSVTLYDRAADRVYRLSPMDKTYTVLSTADFLKLHEDTVLKPVNQMPVRTKTETKVDLAKDNVVQARTIIDKQALLYDLKATLTLLPDRGESDTGGGFSGGRRGRRGGGGFPGGGFPGGGGGGGEGGRRTAQPINSAQIEGEVWLTDAITLKAKGKNPMLPLLVPVVPSEQLLDPLADKIAKSKGFPVATRVTITWRNASTDPKSTTIQSEVKAISEEALDDGLFQIPADYKKLDTH
ncbi:MAG TPA: hypothetical protein VKU00_17015 [Chthonomonadaceae bacterium]|nr:hypothetical protein [Chthonomonadaceae bacterium]